MAHDQPTDRQTVAERLRWAPTPSGPPWRTLIREPSRAVAIMGAVLIVVASLLPWGWAFTRDGRVVVNGYDAAGDGAIMTVLCVILVLAVIWAGSPPATGSDNAGGVAPPSESAKPPPAPTLEPTPKPGKHHGKHGGEGD